MQTGPDVIGGVGVTPPLIAGDQDTGGCDSNDTGQADQLPYVAHTVSVPKLPW